MTNIKKHFEPKVQSVFFVRSKKFYYTKSPIANEKMVFSGFIKSDFVRYNPNNTKTAPLRTVFKNGAAGIAFGVR